MVLGNPHFPWQGGQRFYQSHLTIPGKLDVEGASLFGVPVILIGHTQKLAWSHTVSTARRFSPFQLTLVPGSPTQYLYDGQVRTMKADKVTVQVPGSGGNLVPRTRTLYSTLQGPIMTSLLNLPLFPWTPLIAHALGDANATNFRYLNHFLETDMAQSVRELDAVERKYQGIPWVNTIAADSTRRGVLRRHRRDPARDEREDRHLQHGARYRDAAAARRADPRRDPFGLRVGE